MGYQIDPARLLQLVMLLATGMFVATLIAGSDTAGTGHATGPRRCAWRGMWWMTLLGVASGVAGGLLDDGRGENGLVVVLHAIYRVCWTPAFWVQSLQELLGPGAAWLGPLGLLLVPVLWFSVFLGLGELLARRRRPPP